MMAASGHLFQVHPAMGWPALVRIKSSVPDAEPLLHNVAFKEVQLRFASRGSLTHPWHCLNMFLEWKSSMPESPIHKKLSLYVLYSNQFSDI